MKQCGRRMPRGKDRDQACMARGCRYHCDVGQGGLYQLHARTTAVAPVAAILFPSGRMRSCGCCMLDRRRRDLPHVAFGVRARPGSPRQHIHCYGCMRHQGWHPGSRHGVADPVQDQAKREKQAQGEVRHGPRLPQRSGPRDEQRQLLPRPSVHRDLARDNALLGETEFTQRPDLADLEGFVERGTFDLAPDPYGILARLCEHNVERVAPRVSVTGSDR